MLHILTVPIPTTFLLIHSFCYTFILPSFTSSDFLFTSAGFTSLFGNLPANKSCSEERKNKWAHREVQRNEINWKFLFKIEKRRENEKRIEKVTQYVTCTAFHSIRISSLSPDSLDFPFTRTEHTVLQHMLSQKPVWLFIHFLSTVSCFVYENGIQRTRIQ